MFFDRKEAGQKLAKAISNRRFAITKENAIILALPRGGVIVGQEVSEKLGIPQDLIVVRKIGYPGNPEYAIGAVGESGKLVMGNELIRNEVSQAYLKNEIKKEKEEIKRRLGEYRGDREPPDLKDKIVILVDDGLATGLSMQAAIKEVKGKNPAKIIVAIPVAPKETIEKFKKEVNQIICLFTPEPFFAIGNFYTKFDQVTDEEVKKILG